MEKKCNCNVETLMRTGCVCKKEPEKEVVGVYDEETTSGLLPIATVTSPIKEKTQRYRYDYTFHNGNNEPIIIKTSFDILAARYNLSVMLSEKYGDFFCSLHDKSGLVVDEKIYLGRAMFVGVENAPEGTILYRNDCSCNLFIGNVGGLKNKVICSFFYAGNWFCGDDKFLHKFMNMMGWK